MFSQSKTKPSILDQPYLTKIPMEYLKDLKFKTIRKFLAQLISRSNKEIVEQKNVNFMFRRIKRLYNLMNMLILKLSLSLLS